MKEVTDNYSAIFHFNPLPHWVYDMDTFEILEVNKAAIVLYGYDRSDFLGLTVERLTRNEEVSRLLFNHSQMVMNEGYFDFGISTHSKKDGECIRVQMDGNKLEFEGRQCIVVICQDVTEKELHLLQLIESDKRLKATSAIAKLGYWKLELDANTLSWSDEVYAIWGRNKNDFELNYESFVHTIHPDDKEIFELEQNASFAGDKEHDAVHRIILPNGDIRWVHELGRLIKDENGKAIVFEGTVRDISVEKLEEQRLKLLESVITNANDAVVITEVESSVGSGPIVYVNEAFVKMTGYEVGEITGKNPRFLQGVETEKSELARLSEAIRKIESCEVTLLNYKKTGEAYWVNISISPVVDDKGYCTHWIAIERDVTEQKNKELEQRFLSQISVIFHEEKKLNDASQKLCDVVADFGNFDVTEMWFPNIENTQIQRINYSERSEVASEFYKQALDINSLNWGEGLPGAVWQTKKPILWTDIQNEDLFTRKNAAKNSGLTSILGIPLLFKDAIVGVFVIGSEKKIDKLSKYLTIFQQMETFIGSEINRKKLETDLNHLFEALPDIICLADFQGRFLKMNIAGCKLLGYAEDEILYQSFDKFVHPEDQNISTDEVMKLSEGETVFKFENRYITKQGEIVWLSWICNSGIKEGVIYASAKDITIEKKLRELNRQANSLAKIGSWEVDVIGNKLYWSDLVHELHGTDPKSYFPDLAEGLDFYREDFKQHVKEQVQDCIEKGKSFDFEAVIVTSTNKERWVRVIGRPEVHGTQCVRFYGSFQDINDKKEAEDRLQSLADNLPGVVFQYLIYPDGSDKLKYVSKGSTLVWGISPEESIHNIDSIWNQIRAGGDYESVRLSIMESIKSKSKWTCRWKYVMPNGEVKWHIGYGTPSFSADGKVVFNSMILDVTEEKKLEDLLAQASSLARIGSWEVDLVEEKTYWSEMVHSIHETNSKSFIPDFESSINFFREDFIDIVKNSIQNSISTGAPFNFEAVIVTAQENERWVRGIGNAEIADGKSKRLYGSFQDIHASKILDLQIREILGSISDAFYSLDSNWNFTFFNKEAENLLNRKEVDLIGKNIWQEFPSALDSPLREIYFKIAESGHSESFEYFFPGDGKWYEINTYPSNGGVSSYFKNIDERIKTTEIIQKASEEKTMILESIGDAFFTMDKNFVVTYWNKRAEELVFTKREAIVGRNLLDVFPTAVDLPSYGHYLDVLHTGQTAVFEDYFADKYLEVNAYSSENGLTIFFRDISERKNSEQQIIAANDRFEKVTEATNDVIWDWNIEEDTLYWGSGFKKLFGYNVERISPTLQSWLEHLHPDDQADVQKSFFSVVENPALQNWQSEYRYMRENGTSAFVVDRGIVIRNKEGKAVRMVGAITDISERKMQEVKLQEVNESLKKYAHELEISNEQLEQFAFIASHDLQEPLRMITSFMNQLERKYGSALDKKAHEYIYFATDGAKRMKQIILDLLEYSRAGKFEEKKEIVNLIDLIDDYKTLRRKIIIEKSAILNCSHLPLIKAFRVPLVQTLHCLLDNAMKYSFKNVSPVIEFRIEDKKEEWLFIIKDNGIGISDQFFKKIFIIFQRLHNRDEYSGTGIGLAIAKKHIESWGGKIWLESEVGKGATFYFTLPKNEGD
jgi:PAS domain S-box-containing protein